MLKRPCDSRVFSRGMITVNHSVSYMIEPLANQTHSQGHAVYNTQSLKLPVGNCGHRHGDGNHTENLQELMDVIGHHGHRVRSWA